MLCGIGETFKRLKDSGRKIILFELVYKLGATAIVYPLLILMLEGLLAASGVNYPPQYANPIENVHSKHVTCCFGKHKITDSHDINCHKRYEIVKNQW